MKFRYYITDMLDGMVIGTNDEAKANDLAVSEEHYVVDSETGEWLTSDGKISIEEN